eukprot:762239-Prymnesium_polylepis.1
MEESGVFILGACLKKHRKLTRIGAWARAPCACVDRGAVQGCAATWRVWHGGSITCRAPAASQCRKPRGIWDNCVTALF